VPLGGSVAPGETIDLSLTLTAPDTGGTYRGDYKLRDASNVLFGLGDGTKPFWVQVKVPFETGIVYDFISKAENADWTTGVGNDPGDPIEFDGDDNDANVPQARYCSPSLNMRVMVSSRVSSPNIKSNRVIASKERWAS
jgi:hypothetical protein